MSVHVLDVTPRDVSAAALGLVLDGPAPVPLARLRLDDGRGGAIVLGVLGASHVVTASAGGRQVAEEVSCDAVGAGGRLLPRTARSGGYRLRSSVVTVGRDQLDATADRLRDRAGADPSWLCGAFPGAAGALTALSARPLAGGGWAWRTWHLYPAGDTGEVVTTRTRWTP